MPVPAPALELTPVLPSAPFAQVAPAPATPLALVGTFLAGWAFFAFTAQIAASYALEDPPWRRAIVVGLVPAAASTALIRFDPAVILAVGLAADAAAIRLIYEVRLRTTALMVAIHYAATIALVLLVADLLALLSTAPG